MSRMRPVVGLCLLVLASGSIETRAGDQLAPRLSDYFPPQEEQGGWRSLLPAEGDPDDSHKAKIREVAGVDWDLLKTAWDHNAGASGGTGLLVIRRGYLVGEWYRGGDRTTAFNIYSSSKSYTSTAFGLILSDFGNGALPAGKTLSLDTKVCNTEWIPESLPLPDPRKAAITVRNLLNMTSGLDVQNPPVQDHPFESGAGARRGFTDGQIEERPRGCFPLQQCWGCPPRAFVPTCGGRRSVSVSETTVIRANRRNATAWTQIGGNGAIGPLSQGYSGIFTNPPQHARFCYLAMHKGEWAGKRIVPAAYYDFAWKGSTVKADYGAVVDSTSCSRRT